MLEKIDKVINIFCGLKAVIIGGLFLVMSLAQIITKKFLPVDPAWITIVICGLPLAYFAILALFEEKRITAALLISIAIIASISIGELFAAGEVAFIMAIGGLLEEKTLEKAKKGLHNLISLTPREGRLLLPDGESKSVAVDQISKGDVLRVLPGEAIPVDGEIVSGNSSVDQSVITGESLPIDKSVGDIVFCGTINRFGSIDIVATKVGQDSSLEKLISMVREAENNKAPMQRTVDKWAAWLVPIALAIAVIVYLLTKDITRAVTVLVVFCPCALALATPTCIMAAIGQATKYGVIIKSGDALERMGNINMIAFDKTGTLTHGNLVVTDVCTFKEGLDEQRLLTLTASTEARSEHPLARAINAFAKEKNVILETADDFKMFAGKGIAANIDGKLLLCGNIDFLKENHVEIDESSNEKLNTLRLQGKAVILVAQEKLLIGAIALSDTLRVAAKTIVSDLEQAGTGVLLLTGDHAHTANYFAQQVGIKSVYSELLPAQKVEQIKIIQNQGNNICMIGDGVNDAPALKTANVGVAMGAMGSDISVDAADIALMSDDISRLPYLKRLSNATLKLIKINITLSMLINFVAIGFSAAGFLNPVTGALVHNAGSVLVVFNAALLYDRKF